MKRRNFGRGILVMAITLAASVPGRTAPPPAALDAGRTALEIVAGVQGTWTAPPRRTPSAAMPDGPLMGNGDVGITVGGPPDALRFYVGKSDFFGVVRGGIMPVGSLALSIPALQGASYQMQQNIGPATVTGKFTAGGSALTLASWVADSENLVVVKMTNTGSAPLAVSSQLLDGFSTPGNAATFGSSSDSTWLQVSPDSVEVDIGNQRHGVDTKAPNPVHAFQGQIADARIYDTALAASALSQDAGPTPIAHWQATAADAQAAGGITVDPSAPHGGAAQFMGDRQGAISLGVLRIPQRQFTVAAWVNVSAVNGSQAILSAMSDPYHPRNYPFQRGFGLNLIDGKLSATLNQTTVTAPTPLTLNQWMRVAATYDGQALTIWADGKPLASTHDFPTAADVMGWNQEAIHFGGPALPFAGCGPQGLFVQRVLGASVAASGKGLGFTIPVGGTVTLLLAAVSDRNAPDYAAAAQTLVRSADAAALASLEKQHAAWWNAFWARSFVHIPDKTVQDAWYGSLYLLASCSRTGHPPPGLWGNFITQPLVGWQGDYTLNYNYQAPSWAAYATNHLELADNYEQPLLDYMPRGAAIAAHYGHKGLYYYTHLIPVPGWDDDPSKFLSQKSATLFGAVNCVMRWRYTHDPQYAKKVYPLLRGVADFWDDYLQLQNGRYVDLHDGAWEGPERQDSSDMNPATTLAFLRELYPALIEISEVLKTDADRRPKWNDILAKLSPLPIVPAETLDGIRRQPAATTLQDVLGADAVRGRLAIRATENGAGFPVPEMLAQGDAIQSTSPGMNPTLTIFPGWAIGLESSDQERKAALDTVTLASEWYDFNNNCTFYPAAAAAGYDPTGILQHLDLLLKDHSAHNFALLTGGGGTEDFAVVPAALGQMFLQSYQQNIHLFPDWPSNQDTSFGNLNACGGFLVSSQISGGTVKFAQVVSSAGQPCRLVNPWPGQSVRLTPSTGRPSVLQGTLLTFPTQAGEKILLQPVPKM